MQPVTHRFLAFDLGAESGRAMLGDLTSDRIALREITRFKNQPIRPNGALQWDVLRLWSEMRSAFDRLEGVALDGIGIDTWGCDYALLGERGSLLENPCHYRDSRHDGAMDQVCRRIGREKLYDLTGSVMLINTLLAYWPASPRSTATALMIPDLFNYWLVGQRHSEYSIASTSQMVDARTRCGTRRCSTNSAFRPTCSSPSSSRRDAGVAAPARQPGLRRPGCGAGPLRHGVGVRGGDLTAARF